MENAHRVIDLSQQEIARQGFDMIKPRVADGFVEIALAKRGTEIQVSSVLFGAEIREATEDQLAELVKSRVLEACRGAVQQRILNG